MEITIIVIMAFIMVVCIYNILKVNKQLKGLNEYKARTSNFSNLILDHVIVSTEQLVSEYDRVAKELKEEGYDVSWYPEIRKVFKK